MSTITYVLKHIDDVPRYESLQNEREETMVQPEFQQWMAEFNVSRSYVDPDAYLRANELTAQYDYSNRTSKSSFLNFLKIKGIW
jgi:hypothetical protein